MDTQTRITPEEAQEALDLVAETTRQMRRALAHGGMPYFLLIWGFVWLLGFGSSHFFGAGSSTAGLIWAVLDAGGAVASFAVGAHLGKKIRSPRGMRIGLYWLALLFYGALLIYFAHPQTSNQGALLISLLAMMGYVTSGLLYDSRFLTGLGLAVTVLILVGYLAVPTVFNLWMALWGGGSLIAAGVYILRKWR